MRIDKKNENQTDEKDNKTDQIIKKDDNNDIIRPSSIQKDQ